MLHQKDLGILYNYLQFIFKKVLEESLQKH